MADRTPSSGWTQGKQGGALTFDGVDDYVDVASALTITAYPFSMCAWVRQNTSADGNTFLSLLLADGSGNQYFSLETRSGKFSIVARNTAFTNALGTTAVNNGTWYEVCGIFESATSKKLFVNGLQEANNTTSVTFPAVNRFYIGRLRDDGTGPFPGSIDDVRIYNRALTGAEVKRLFNTGAGSHINVAPNNDSLTKGLVGYWTFDGKNGTADASGNKNNGTATNGPRVTQGKIGQALQFDGVNDYVSVGTNLGNAQTISYWIKSNNQANGGIELNANQYITDNAVPEGFADSVTYIDGVAQGSLFGSELVTNGNMEANSTWVDDGGATQGQSSDTAHTGTYSWRVISCCNYVGAREGVTVSASTLYKMSGWIYTNGGVPGYLSFGEISTDYGWVFGTSAATWTYGSSYITTPASPGSVYVRIRSLNGATTSYFDDVSLKQVLTRYPLTDTTKWHHVVVTTNTAISASAVKIGKGGSSYMNGSLDDVRIYNRALTGAEIQRLYNGGR